MSLRTVFAICLTAACVCGEEVVRADSPAHLWSQRFGNSSSQYAHDVATDASGNVVITGKFTGQVDFGGGALTTVDNFDIFVAKFDRNGNHLWSRRFGEEGAQVGQRVAVDGSGNVLLVGDFFGNLDFGGGTMTSDLFGNIFVVKLDPNGNHLWSHSFGDSNESEWAFGVAADALGNVIVAGYYEGDIDLGGGTLTSAGGDDVFLAKFDSGGSHLWSQRFGGATLDHLWDVVVDSADRAVITGMFGGVIDFGGGTLTSTGGSDAYLAKFDTGGGHVWSQRFGDSGSQIGRRLGCNASGDLALAGSFDGAVDFGGGLLTSAGGHDAFVARFDSNGNHVWSQRFGDADHQIALGVAIDAADNVAITGHFEGTVDFGGGVLTSTDIRDVFVAKFDAIGDHVWSGSYGDSFQQLVENAAMDPTGNFLVTGHYYGSVDFGGGPLLSAGSLDVFLVKFGVNAVPTSATGAPTPEFAITGNYPNPFNPVTTITYSIPRSGHVSLSVHNIRGRLIKMLVGARKPAGENSVTWNGQDANGRAAASGVYFVRMEFGGRVKAGKIILLK